MFALKPLSDANKTPQELQIAAELYKKELEEMNALHASALKELNTQIDSLRKSVENKDSTARELGIRCSERDAECARLRSEIEIAAKEAAAKAKRAEEERRKLREAIELDLSLKTSNMNTTVERMKLEHAVELERVKQQSEAAVKDIKYIYEQEKHGLEERLSKSHNEVLELQKQKDQGLMGSTGTQNCINEIRELNAHLDAFKKQSQEEIATLKRQRDEAIKRADSMEEELSSLRHTMRNTQMIHEQSAKNFRQKLEKAQQLIESNENAQTELQKVRKQVADLKNAVAKGDSSEKRLKSVILQKEKELEDERVDHKRKLNSEKKKAIQAHEGYARVKEEYEHKKTAILREISAKDELIGSLSKQLEEAQRKQIVGLEAYATVKEATSRRAINKTMNLPRIFPWLLIVVGASAPDSDQDAKTETEIVVTATKVAGERRQSRPQALDKTKGCTGLMSIDCTTTTKIRRTDLKLLQEYCL